MDTVSVCLTKKLRQSALFHPTIQHCNPNGHRFHCDGAPGGLTTCAHSESRHVHPRPCENPPKVSVWTSRVVRYIRLHAVRCRARLPSARREAGRSAGETHAVRRLSSSTDNDVKSGSD
ncbi:unnamed protein product [Pieris brassicae]|uniref:Uncharacterized protein n=1 Tax=Pieris brassicae TaxID=7116 RepID=A0A9P0TMJ1_PIEBR|nr:unnamed protein product [Pieris brassicae]